MRCSKNPSGLILDRGSTVKTLRTYRTELSVFNPYDSSPQPSSCCAIGSHVKGNYHSVSLDKGLALAPAKVDPHGGDAHPESEVIPLETLDLLSSEEAVVLPEREALSFIDFLNLTAVNAAVSTQVLTSRSSSHATAGQWISVSQH